MNGKIHFKWFATLAVAFALITSTTAAQKVTNNENTTNKASYTSDSSKSKKVNINTASKSELEALPGIGPSVADNIIAARPFKSVKDLKNVSGIGEKRFEEILPHVT